MTQALAVQIVLLGSMIAHNTLQPYSNMILNRLEHRVCVSLTVHFMPVCFCLTKV